VDYSPKETNSGEVLTEYYTLLFFFKILYLKERLLSYLLRISNKQQSRRRVALIHDASKPPPCTFTKLNFEDLSIRLNAT
jgi:hypothetical protein